MTTPFLLTPDNALAPLKRPPYNSEDLFQRLLADHPALRSEIAGTDGIKLKGRHCAGSFFRPLRIH